MCARRYVCVVPLLLSSMLVTSFCFLSCRPIIRYCCSSLDPSPSSLKRPIKYSFPLGTGPLATILEGSSPFPPSSFFVFQLDLSLTLQLCKGRSAFHSLHPSPSRLFVSGLEYLADFHSFPLSTRGTYVFQCFCFCCLPSPAKNSNLIVRK
jgi:hypothetical protein